MLNRWLKLVEATKTATAAEKELREQLVSVYFPAAKLGTTKLHVDGIGQLEVTMRENVTIDPAGVDAVRAALYDVGINLDDVISYTPKLISKGYKALDGQSVRIVNRCLTVKPGMPTLVFKDLINA
jgi:hypothetical protein